MLYATFSLLCFMFGSITAWRPLRVSRPLRTLNSVRAMSTMKLATVEVVQSLSPIPWADKIEKAKILGWDIIVKKGQYSPGDRCVYVPIDTVADTTKPWFAQLEKTAGRVKTMRVRDVYSQGYTIHPGELDFALPEEIGTDVAQLVGVRKYEKASSLENGLAPNFPSHIISRTDEDNLRTKIECLEEVRGKEVYVTKKMDGSSLTMIWRQGEFFLCSRNVILHRIDPNGNVVIKNANNAMAPMEAFCKKFNFPTRFRDRNIAIQGEFCGPGVNGNQMKLKDYAFYAFNVKDLDENRWFALQELQQFTQEQDMTLVPLLDVFHCTEDHTVDYFQNIANEIKYGESEGEGIVVRPTVPFFSETLGKPLSFKIINQKYKD